jgi:hypothetical protein
MPKAQKANFNLPIPESFGLAQVVAGPPSLGPSKMLQATLVHVASRESTGTFGQRQLLDSDDVHNAGAMTSEELHQGPHAATAS